LETIGGGSGLLGDVPDDASDGISLVDGGGQLTHKFGEEDEETQEMVSLWPALPSEISLKGHVTVNAIARV